MNAQRAGKFILFVFQNNAVKSYDIYLFKFRIHFAFNEKKKKNQTFECIA